MIATATRRAMRLALAATLATSFIAAPAFAELELKTEDEETIYILGTTLGRSLKGFHLSEDEMKIVIRGIEDEVAGKLLLVEIPQASDRVQAFFSKRSAEAAAGERKESEAFLERQAGLEGAKKFDSGLIITELVVGDGASPEPSDTVKVHYHGTLRDGTVFDSSVLRGDPAEFPLNRVIPCWTEGVATMKVGGKSRLVCPPDIAYGDRGAPPMIPGGAALVFEVELLEVKKE